ncbi:hypothetical protein EVAR_71873_1, partial [Eumeta japonica]
MKGLAVGVESQRVAEPLGSVATSIVRGPSSGGGGGGGGGSTGATVQGALQVTGGPWVGQIRPSARGSQHAKPLQNFP